MHGRVFLFFSPFASLSLLLVLFLAYEQVFSRVYANFPAKRNRYVSTDENRTGDADLVDAASRLNGMLTGRKMDDLLAVMAIGEQVEID